MLTFVVGNHKHLANAEYSTGEVQDDIANAPAHCALSTPVQVGLWYVLDQGDEQLHIGADVEEVEILQDGSKRKNQRDCYQQSDRAEEDLAYSRDRLRPSL